MSSMNTLKRILLSLSLALGLTAPALAPAVAHAIENDALECGANLQLARTGCEDDGGSATEVDNIIQTAIDIISIAVGIVAVIMIIIGGFRYVTSNGDSGAVTGAKNTILYAVVGLVVVAVAQIIVRFVVGELTSEEGGAGGGGGGAGGGGDSGIGAGDAGTLGLPPP